jgi:hypothetical protein
MNQLHFTFHKVRKDGFANKMDGMISINTNSVTNPFCQRMRLTDAVCKSCYNKRLERFTAKAFQRNNDLFLDENYQPEKIMYNTIRFHSFGELLNATHYKNIIKLCEYNPNTSFTLWSKRADIIGLYEKPVNLINIYSSHKMNVEERLPINFDKVFTVYNPAFIRENGIEINCKKSCYSCGICYSKNDITYVKEQIKHTVKKNLT